MTSSLFQTSRLKTVSKTLLYLLVFVCVRVLYVCQHLGCVFYFLFFCTYLCCVCTQMRECVCVSSCLPVASPLLTHVLSGELQQSCRSTGRCMGGGGGGVGRGYFCLSSTLSPFFSLCLSILLFFPSITHVPLTTAEMLLHCDLFA